MVSAIITVIPFSGCSLEPTWSAPNIITSLNTAGLTWQAYCEHNGSTRCPRYADHFPFLAFSNTFNSANAFSSNTVSTTDFISAANSANPPNLLWYTPTDGNNMHDNSVTSGDTYLKNFLVGSSGSVTNPGSGSLLATKLFNLSQRTLLILWWDEPCTTDGPNANGANTCGRDGASTPNIFYDPQGVRPGATISTSNTYDHFSVTRLIEDNWALGQLTGTTCGSGNTEDNCAIGLKSDVSPALSASAPDLVGWGGIRLDEVTHYNSTNIQSYAGGLASNTEQVIYTLQQKGLNVIRVSFDPYCTDSAQADLNDMSFYSQANMQTTINIASHYGFWVVFDYHGYTDIFQNNSCWTNFWFGPNNPASGALGVIGAFASSYSQIIWEPDNEPEYTSCANAISGTCDASQMPCNSDTSCMTVLNQNYNSWILKTRSTPTYRDSHWVIVQNLCSFSCSSLNSGNGDGNGIGAVTGYPQVADSSFHVLLSLHSYMNYQHYAQSQYGGWNTANANSVALGYYRTVLGGISTFHWPAFNSEGGADPLCEPDQTYANNEGQPYCPSQSDRMLLGSAGYTTTTQTFIQALSNLYSNGTMHIGFAWWTAGDWTDTPGSFQYGSLQCNVLPANKSWGCFLSYPFPPSTTLSPSPWFTTLAAEQGYVQTVPFVTRDPPLLTGQSARDLIIPQPNTTLVHIHYTLTPSTFTSAYSTTFILTMTITFIQTDYCPPGIHGTEVYVLFGANPMAVSTGTIYFEC